MKRIQLFEFEDLGWFPDWIRVRMTRLIMVMHGLLDTKSALLPIIEKTLKETGANRILDLCSGSGGPMIDVFHELKTKSEFENLHMSLSDLYPNQSALAGRENLDHNISYKLNPVDATDVGSNMKGLRTMVSSFHHMTPKNAHEILKSAKEARQPICIFEISDNAPPIFLWWIAFPINIIMCLFVTPLARPMTWQQLVFTYLIPIIPIFFAWDGAVSNARTYTLSDMDKLLQDLRSPTYQWETGKIKGKGGNKLFLVGKPI